MGIAFIHFYLPRVITETKNPIIELFRSKKEYTNSTQLETFTFKSFDNNNLVAQITRSQQDSTFGTIILVHGIRSNKSYYNDLTKKLSINGFNCVGIDLRAHGESEGSHCTFGVKEKRDVSALLDHLPKENIDISKVGIWGQSLGGAVALQSLGTDHRIRFGIVESTFTDFRSIVHDYFEYHMGFRNETISNYLVDRSAKIAGFDPEDANPKKYCQQITQPVLIVHGDKDQRISITYGRENFTAILSENKEFLPIANANHLNVHQTGGEEYFITVLSFIGSVLDDS